jgi:hypothetical protein
MRASLHDRLVPSSGATELAAVEPFVDYARVPAPASVVTFSLDRLQGQGYSWPHTVKGIERSRRDHTGRKS